MEKTFLAKQIYSQNDSWQGTIELIGENGGKKKQSFRSALELIRLIDSAAGAGGRPGREQSEEDGGR